MPESLCTTIGPSPSRVSYSLSATTGTSPTRPISSAIARSAARRKGCGAVQAALLLDGRAQPELAGERPSGELAQQQVHDREHHPVVHRSADEVVADAARA